MDDTPHATPHRLDAILADARALGFAMSCEDRTGSLLATLAASKPAGRILELGTGVGAGAAWLLHGMDRAAHLTTIDIDATVQAVAAKHLGSDPRITIVEHDADEWLAAYTGRPFDLAYIDCRPGKFHRLPNLLDLLRPGALYVVDDLEPQPTWPGDHQPRVDAFLARLPDVHELLSTPIAWASGLVVAARI
ncbi:MAG TPA: class I SAM-dependent methyltransferase [Jiangellaceae bacterium]